MMSLKFCIKKWDKGMKRGRTVDVEECYVGNYTNSGTSIAGRSQAKSTVNTAFDDVRTNATSNFDVATSSTRA